MTAFTFTHSILNLSKSHPRPPAAPSISLLCRLPMQSSLVSLPALFHQYSREAQATSTQHPNPATSPHVHGHGGRVGRVQVNLHVEHVLLPRHTQHLGTPPAGAQNNGEHFTAACGMMRRTWAFELRIRTLEGSAAGELRSNTQPPTFAAGAPAWCAGLSRRS